MTAENKRKVEMIEQLKSRGYRSDPLKAWRAETSDEHEEGEETEEMAEGKGQPDYNYLLSMQLWSLTREKKEELLKNRDKKVSLCLRCGEQISVVHVYLVYSEKVEELRILREKTPKDLWKEDINEFMEELDVSGQRCDSPKKLLTHFSLASGSYGKGGGRGWS